jgi:ATP-dependent exoDNAse (exonuclease V) beta subunit
VVWGDGYAGTVDFLCEIEGQVYLVDFKTSQYIWPSHELQISAYAKAMPEQKSIKLAILQLGYRLNKSKFKFTEIDNKFQEFLAAKTIWANETKGVEPKQKDYPMEIAL